MTISFCYSTLLTKNTPCCIALFFTLRWLQTNVSIFPVHVYAAGIPGSCGRYPKNRLPVVKLLLLRGRVCTCVAGKLSLRTLHYVVLVSLVKPLLLESVKYDSSLHLVLSLRGPRSACKPVGLFLEWAKCKKMEGTSGRAHNQVFVTHNWTCIVFKPRCDKVWLFLLKCVLWKAFRLAGFYAWGPWAETPTHCASYTSGEPVNTARDI